MNIRVAFTLLRQAILNAANPEEHRKKIIDVLRADNAKHRFEYLAYHSEESGVKNPSADNSQLIVSITSHGKRVLTVHRTIESIFQQSLKADRVILYLGNQEYQQIDQLPIVIRRQIDRGLEVRFVQDQGPYTKLLPALHEFPESDIITFDDDTLYPINAIERLVNAHRDHPKAICALEARKIQWKNATEFKTYNDFPFPHDIEDLSSPLYIAEGFGGILYPSHCFSSQVFDRELYMQLAPTADDLWFWAMSLVNSTSVVKVQDYFRFDYERYLDDDTQDIGLCNNNLFNGGNDKQLKALCDYFHLYDLLKE